MKRLLHILLRHRDWWLLVDNGGGTRLLKCRKCGIYKREDYSA